MSSGTNASPHRLVPCSLIVLGLALLASLSHALLAQRPDAFHESRDHASIEYSSGAVTDPISRLNRKLQQGEVNLEYEPVNGYLRALLKALDVPVESQVLVHSETSAQARFITPANPRAIFFGDDVSIGRVRGGRTLEVAAQDPRQGVIFYTLEQKATGIPQLQRDDSCLQCHLSWDTLAVPGLMAISTFPMPDKTAYAGGMVTDHRTPMDFRWGGWYVTGNLVPGRHLGNLPVVQPPLPPGASPPPAPALRSVEKTFDTSEFLLPYSDIVALMVLEHQTHMTNLLTRTGWEARLAEHQAQTGVDAKGTRTDRVSEAVRDLVDYMLFVDEAPIPSRIEGSSGFADVFGNRGPRDSRGRSLRQFDLERRLMRYPCSYMIYSEAFDALPDAARDATYRRLWQVLSGEETGDRYVQLSAADRQAILEILRDTKKDLPPYFLN